MNIIALIISFFVLIAFIGFSKQIFNKKDTKDKTFWKPFYKIFNWLVYFVLFCLIFNVFIYVYTGSVGR